MWEDHCASGTVTAPRSEPVKVSGTQRKKEFLGAVLNDSFGRSLPPSLRRRGSCHEKKKKEERKETVKEFTPGPYSIKQLTVCQHAPGRSV